MDRKPSKILRPSVPAALCVIVEVDVGIVDKTRDAIEARRE